MVAAAAALEGADGMLGVTYATFFGLIAATGMRLSEAIGLSDSDVNLVAGHLTVRMMKFCKSCRLPLQASAVAALVTCRERRDRCWPRDPEGPFFVGHRGAALKKRTVHGVFDGLRRTLGWNPRGSYPKLRIHDLRHTFAVRRVQLWHEQDTPIEPAMFWLCSYLWHSKISDTYWYLTDVPELMAAAGRRFEPPPHGQLDRGR